MTNSLNVFRRINFVGFCVASALTLGFYFLPWRFVIPGYRFPYHGSPSLIVGLLAFAFGLVGAMKNWRHPNTNWPWLASSILTLIQLAFLVGFLLEPNIAIGRGTSVAPWGENPIEMQFDIKPLWGAYAATIGSVVTLLLGLTSLIANWKVKTQFKMPSGLKS